MNQTTLAALKNPPATNAPAEVIRAGFDTAGGFDLMQRGAYLLANSTIVPAQYRALNVKRDKYGHIIKEENNPAALSNCVVALNMAQRMGADPLMIMQNLYIVEGRPAWSSQYIIASINASGKYSPLRFKLEYLGKKEVEYVETLWENSKLIKHSKKVTVQDMKCVAWALEKKTGEALESPPVTIELAVKEGWYSKSGSKWQTMPEVMLRYRAASFFGKLYAPELLMGIQTAEELHDSTYDMELASSGGYQVTTDEIRRNEPEAAAEVPEVKKASQSAQPIEPKQEKKAAPAAKPAQQKAAESAPAQKPAPAQPEEAADDFFQGDAMTIECPNKGGKQVDEINCASCPSREGCLSWE